MKKYPWLIFAAVLIGAFLFVAAFGTVLNAVDPNTCGTSDEDMLAFLDETQGNEPVFIKSGKNGRISAIIYERQDIGLCAAFFESRLFGLRLEYLGMNQLSEDGIGQACSWNSAGLGSKCFYAVCGDNRSGAVGSYSLDGHTDVARSGLEKDYILDIYILDGIKAFPTGFRCFAPDGSEIVD